MKELDGSGEGSCNGTGHQYQDHGNTFGGSPIRLVAGLVASVTGNFCGQATFTRFFTGNGGVTIRHTNFTFAIVSPGFVRRLLSYCNGTLVARGVFWGFVFLGNRLRLITV